MKMNVNIESGIVTYTFEDGLRLRVRDQDGRALPDDTVLVSGEIQ